MLGSTPAVCYPMFKCRMLLVGMDQHDMRRLVGGKRGREEWEGGSRIMYCREHHPSCTYQIDSSTTW